MTSSWMARLCVLALPLAASARAEDWPEWRGPRRDGVSTEAGWLEGWPAGGVPPIAFRVQVGKGHSAVSIARGRAYTLGWDGREESLLCLDAATGEVRWRRGWPSASIAQWPGPRSTPTVDGGKVYTLGQHGELRAWDAASGEERWRLDLDRALFPDVDYGFPWSPLVIDGRLLLPAGEGGIAIDVETGRVLWGGRGGRGACASPVPIEVDGRRGAVLLLTDPERKNVHLLAVEAASGKVHWRSPPWPERWGAACVDPVIREGKVFIATAEQHLRGARFSVAGGGLHEDWSSSRFAAYTGTPVLIGGHLYGVARPGVLRSLEWETGRETWAQRGFGVHGSLIAAAGMLLVQSSESGELAVVEASPDAYRERRRGLFFRGEPATFTAPVLSGGRIYLRSYAGEVVCLAPLAAEAAPRAR